MRQARIRHRGETRTAPAEGWQPVLDEMIARLGPWESGSSLVEMVETIEPEQPAAAPVYSDWGKDKQVVDEAARARVQGQRDQLAAAGMGVSQDVQLYATGTRMAKQGYDTQRERKREHETMQPARDAIGGLISQVIAEQRTDKVVVARDVAAGLAINGKLTFDGMKLQEQAIRGLLARLDSPASRYVFGLRDRIAETRQTDKGRELDKAALLDVLQRELRRFPETKLKLRTRPGLGDVFTVVSPEYAEADAPAVLPELLAELDAGSKASVSYDPGTTSWEVRAQVFTPTPTDEQVVGEPFRGWSSLRSRDNGTGRLWGGGGFDLLACLNAMIHAANIAGLSRVHRGQIMRDLSVMMSEATNVIRVLLDAWGVARQDVIELPRTDAGLVPIELAIPGFYRAMLTPRRGELVGILPGRTEDNVKTLAAAYIEQRRNPQDVTRADLAQGWTRAIQSYPIPVRRDAEAAIGGWLVNREKVGYVAA